ncbi:MAG: cold shock domain-containing protein [bacterium]
MERNIFKKLKKIVFDQGHNNALKRKSGTITWLNREKGYGIVNYDQGEEVFVHYDPLYGKHYHSLKKEDRSDIPAFQRKKEKHVDFKHDDHKMRVTKPTHYRGIK